MAIISNYPPFYGQYTNDGGQTVKSSWFYANMSTQMTACNFDPLLSPFQARSQAFYSASTQNPLVYYALTLSQLQTAFPQSSYVFLSGVPFYTVPGYGNVTNIQTLYSSALPLSAAIPKVLIEKKDEIEEKKEEAYVESAEEKKKLKDKKSSAPVYSSLSDIQDQIKDLLNKKR
jgi:hypothetical protein